MKPNRWHLAGSALGYSLMSFFLAIWNWNLLTDLEMPWRAIPPGIFLGCGVIGLFIALAFINIRFK